jgi:hypothetical protein
MGCNSIILILINQLFFLFFYPHFRQFILYFKFKRRINFILQTCAVNVQLPRNIFLKKFYHIIQSSCSVPKMKRNKILSLIEREEKNIILSFPIQLIGLMRKSHSTKKHVLKATSTVIYFIVGTFFLTSSKEYSIITRNRVLN